MRMFPTEEFSNRDQCKRNTSSASLLQKLENYHEAISAIIFSSNLDITEVEALMLVAYLPIIYFLLIVLEHFIVDLELPSIEQDSMESGIRKFFDCLRSACVIFTTFTTRTDSFLFFVEKSHLKIVSPSWHLDRLFIDFSFS